MLYPVYICEDYDFENGKLTIYDGELIAMIRSLDDFEPIKYTPNYNAMICPEFYQNDKGETAKIVIFK